MLPSQNGSPPDRALQVLLDIAAEVEAAEVRLKQEIIAAAEAGDHARVIAIAKDWLANPPAEVLSHALINAEEIR